MIGRIYMSKNLKKLTGAKLGIIISLAIAVIVIATVVVCAAAL